jgi:hypothetical protein
MEPEGSTEVSDTRWLAMQDTDEPVPWGVAAFNRDLGMALWFPEAGVWVDDPDFLAPYFIMGEPGARPITAEEAAALVASGVGPPGKPLRGAPVTEPARLVGLPTP